MADVYEIITKQITEKLENGCVPWHKPWKGGSNVPVSLITKKAYRGINVLVLLIQGFSSQYWLTFNQAKKLGGSVKKGQKGTPVIYWNWFKKEVENPKTGEKKIQNIPFLKYYTVFNVEQTEGIEYPKPEVQKANGEIKKCQEIVENFADKPEVVVGGNRASYNPRTDTLDIPSITVFDSSEEFYSTEFHEFVHATGHENRLNRKTLTDICPFGSTNYSKEELVAEIGAAFLCGITGIENKTIDNSASYIQNWLKALKNDKKLVVMAGGQAQKAVDYILGKQNEKEEPNGNGKKKAKKS
jgi:antirestriction protein ArdC